MEQEAHRFYGDSSGLRTLGKRGAEWSLNDWKWDGDLFIATPLDSVSCSAFRGGRKFIPVSVAGHSSNSSSSCSDEVQQRRELERNKRAADDSLEDEAGTLTLKLGGSRYPVSVSSDAHAASALDAVSGKKAKLAGAPTNRAICQVENCGSDLSTAKDYHRRHKVCEMHSKATKALVGNVMQRFCQQCSRFHVLQEFDEGKRSCRRRLAGHNKRRRKTQPETVTSANSVNNEQASNYLLVSLLRLLSSVHGSNRSDLMTEQDLVAHLLGSLANRSGSPEANDISGLLHESQKLLNGQLTSGNAEKISDFISNVFPYPPRPVNQQHLRMSISEIAQEGGHDISARDGSPLIASSEKHNRMSENDRIPICSEIREDPVGGTKLNNFDLNDMYVDSDDGTEDVERSPVTGNFQTGSVDCPSWARHDSQQSSPPQISGNSDSASAQSPSSSSGEAQSRTDRIVFKLFGKEPNDFPLMLRAQILDWLAHSPTDMESYIRPGCVILTIYVRLAESIWDEVCSDLSSCLSRFLDMHDDPVWQSGWLFMRLQNQAALVRDGQMVVSSLLPMQKSYCSSIVSVTPIAVAISGKAQFQIKGSNLCRSTTRLLCALEGQYLVLEDCHDQESYPADNDISADEDVSDCVRLSYSIPSVIGRGFIEVEDDGISSSFFPFIVAETDVCSEIRTLESVLCVPECSEDASAENAEIKHEAMGFMHEMGWLLHRCQLKSRLDDLDNPNHGAFSFKRFTWLLEFSIDHDWSAVVKKLLDISIEGIVDTGEHCSLEAALSGMGLLHKAVRRNSRTLVELLLKYVLPVPVKEGGYEYEGKIAASVMFDNRHNKYLFKPDAKGPSNLTPLHLAAGRDGSEDILDALTDDPEKVGIGAWKNARDSTGSSPEDYARLRGHYAYIHLVQKKINKRPPSSGSVAVDMPDEVLSEISGSSKQSLSIGAAASLEIVGGRRALSMRSCRVCCEKKQNSYASVGIRSSLVYRPAMLSMVAIAAVCVCVALLFKSLPEVVYVFRPFRWEMLDYGSI